MDEIKFQRTPQYSVGNVKFETKKEAQDYQLELEINKEVDNMISISDLPDSMAQVIGEFFEKHGRNIFEHTKKMEKLIKARRSDKEESEDGTDRESGEPDPGQIPE